MASWLKNVAGAANAARNKIAAVAQDVMEGLDEDFEEVPPAAAASPRTYEDDAVATKDGSAVVLASDRLIMDATENAAEEAMRPVPGPASPFSRAAGAGQQRQRSHQQLQQDLRAAEERNESILREYKSLFEEQRDRHQQALARIDELESMITTKSQPQHLREDQDQDGQDQEDNSTDPQIDQLNEELAENKANLSGALEEIQRLRDALQSIEAQSPATGSSGVNSPAAVFSYTSDGQMDDQAMRALEEALVAEKQKRMQVQDELQTLLADNAKLVDMNESYRQEKEATRALEETLAAEKHKRMQVQEELQTSLADNAKLVEMTESYRQEKEDVSSVFEEIITELKADKKELEEQAEKRLQHVQREFEAALVELRVQLKENEEQLLQNKRVHKEKGDNAENKEEEDDAAAAHMVAVLREENTNLQAEIEAFRETLVQEKKTHAEALASFKTEVTAEHAASASKAHERIRVLEERVSAATAETEKLRAAAVAAQQSESADVEAVAVLRETHSSLQAEFDAFRERVKTEKQEALRVAETASAEIRSLKEKVVEASSARRADMAASRAKHAEMVAHAKSLEARVDEAVEAVAVAKTEHAERERTLTERLDKVGVAAQHRISVLEGELDAALKGQEANELEVKRRIVELEDELESARKGRQDEGVIAQKRISELERELNAAVKGQEHEEVIKQLRAKCSKSQEDIAARDKELKEALKREDAAAKVIAERDAAVASLRDDSVKKAQQVSEEFQAALLEHESALKKSQGLAAEHEAALRKSIEALNERGKELQRLHEAHENVVTELKLSKEDHVTKDASIAETERDLDALREKLTASTDDIAARDSTIAQLRESLAGKSRDDDAQVRALNQTLDGLRDEMAAAKRRHDEEMEELRTFLGDVGDKRIAAVKEELKEARDQLLAVQEREAVARDTIAQRDDAVAQRDTMVSRLQEERVHLLADHEKRVSDLQSEWSKNREQDGEADEAYKKRISSLESELAGKETALQSLAKRVEDLEKDVIAANAQVGHAQDRTAKLEQDLVRARESSSSSNEQVNKRMALMQEELAAARASEASSVSKLQVQAKQLQEELHAADARATRLSTEAKVQQTQVQERQAAHERQIEQLSQELRDAHAEIKRLRTHLRETELDDRDHDAHTNQELAELREQLAQSALDMEAMQAVATDFAELQRQYDLKEEECSRQEEAVKNLRSLVETLQIERDERGRGLESELEAARTASAESEAALARAQSALDEMTALRTALDEERARLTASQQYATKLVAENDTLRRGLDQTMQRLHAFSTMKEKEGAAAGGAPEYLVDRRLVVSFLVALFGERQPQEEVLSVMARVLKFNEDETKRIMGSSSSAAQRHSVTGQLMTGVSALKTFLSPFDDSKGARRRGQGSAMPDVDKNSLADLWVEFLLQETQPGTVSNASSGGIESKESEALSGPAASGAGDVGRPTVVLGSAPL